jgi:hypothetical protein
MVHHLSLGNAGYRLDYRVPLLEQNDCHFAQSKGIRAVPKNRILTDVLKQQGAGPVIREHNAPPYCDLGDRLRNVRFALDGVEKVFLADERKV